MPALSARSEQLAARVGPRLQLSVGPVVAGAGVAMLTLAASGSSYVVSVLPGGHRIRARAGYHGRTAHRRRDGRSARGTLGHRLGCNNDVARFGGLLAVAVLPAPTGITGTAYLHPAALAAGFRTAALMSGAMCAAGGLRATNSAHVPHTAGAP